MRRRFFIHRGADRPTQFTPAPELAGVVIPPEALRAAAEQLQLAGGSGREPVADWRVRNALLVTLPHITGADAYAAGYRDRFTHAFNDTRRALRDGPAGPRAA